MTAQRSLVALLSIFSAASMGCAADDLDLTPGDLSFRNGREAPAPGDPEGGAWINNGLDDPSVSGIDPAFALSEPGGLASDLGLLLDPARRDTVQYLVECALPEGSQISKLVGGELLTFDGWLGLAPEWESEACDEDCQQWVTACLLARTNVTGETVSIWMRADHPAIGEGLHPLYPGYEASFFGNIFADPESQHFCQGTVVGPTLAQLEGRTCAGLTNEQCGFIKYTECSQVQRCSFAPEPAVGELAPSPTNCISGAVNGGSAFHTISTYVGPL